jgi:hypothetical protein
LGTRTEQGFRLLPKRKSILVAKSKKSRAEVFLNIPYDYKFERLFLAYIAGISTYGMVPRATLEITDSSEAAGKDTEA